VIIGKNERKIKRGLVTRGWGLGTPRVHRAKRCLTKFVAAREPKKRPWFASKWREGFSLSGGRIAKKGSNEQFDILKKTR
jgi:hypothetical protein